MMSLLYVIIVSMVFGHVPSVFLATTTTVALHDIFILVWIVLYLRKATINTIHPLGTPIAVFVAFAILSLAVNLWQFPVSELITGTAYLARWTMYAVFFLCASSYLAKSMQRNILQVWLYGAGVVFGLAGIIQILLYPSLQNLQYLGWDPHYYRLFSTLLDPNFAGIWLVLTLLLGLSLNNRMPIIIWYVGQLVTLTALLLTYSRSSYLAFGVGVISWIIITKSWKLLGIFAVFIGLFFLIPRTSLDVIRLDRWQSSIVRLENWRYNLTLISLKPLFGYGFNTLPSVRPGRGTDTSRAGAGLDNSFLFVWAASGFGGLSSFLAILGSMWQVARNKRDRSLLRAVILSLSVHSLFNNSWFFSWILVWVWLIIASVESTSDR